jgi:ATP-dependent exoDNAse (exonuclease V) beta subunit
LAGYGVDVRWDFPSGYDLQGRGTGGTRRRPLQERIESVADDADLQEVYDTERHLLYVACTRARDHLLVSGVDPVSEFLDDFQRSGLGQLGAAG